MAQKATFGEFSAFQTQGGVRFMKGNKLASEKVLPTEVVDYLKKQLGAEEPRIEPPQYAPPTEEEKAKLKAESMQVPPELQRTPEEMAEATPAEPPLTAEDFDMGLSQYADQEGMEPPVVTTTELGKMPEEAAPKETLEPTLGEQAEARPAEIDSDFLEQVSIHTASLEDIVEALYNRFGIYTVYLRKLPEADEINPLTAENFSKYHLGIAYQASIYATNKGLLDIPPETGRHRIDEGREAAKTWKVDQQPRTVGEARRMNTFDHRTSPEGTREEARTEIVHVTNPDGTVHAVQREIPEGETGHHNGARARYDKDEDEPIVEPQFGKKVIRPNW